MPELIDDPLVLDAALALVDDCHATDEKGGLDDAMPEPVTETVSTPSVHKRKYPQQLLQAASHRADLFVERYEGREEEDEHDVMTIQDEQARRVVLAAYSLNRLQNAMSLSARLFQSDRIQIKNANRAVLLQTSVIQSFTIRPLDADRIIDTLSNRLDALAMIARTHPTTSSSLTKGGVQEFAYTPSGFRMLAHSRIRLPFKLSIVADGMWEFLKTVRQGPNRDNELSIQRRNEVFAMVASNVWTSSGFIASEGPTAMRRVFEADGSVLMLHTVICTAPPTSRQHVDPDSSQNLFAGCTVKQAGWKRLRLVSTRHGRPLVLAESRTGIVVEASPGCSISRDRQQQALRALNELSSSKPRTRQTLENLLLDMSLASRKSESLEPDDLTNSLQSK